HLAGRTDIHQYLLSSEQPPERLLVGALHLLAPGLGEQPGQLGITLARWTPLDPLHGGALALQRLGEQLHPDADDLEIGVQQRLHVPALASTSRRAATAAR